MFNIESYNALWLNDSILVSKPTIEIICKNSLPPTLPEAPLVITHAATYINNMQESTNGAIVPLPDTIDDMNIDVPGNNISLHISPTMKLRSSWCLCCYISNYATAKDNDMVTYFGS